MNLRPGLCRTLLLLALLPAYAFAQKAVFRFPASGTVLKPLQRSLILHSADGYTCIVLKSSDKKLTYLLLDSDFRLLEQMEESWSSMVDLFLSERIRPLGLPVYKDSVLRFCFVISPPHAQDLVVEKTINFRDKSTMEKRKLSVPGSPLILGYFLSDKEYPWAVVLRPHHEDSLELYRQDEDGSARTRNVDISKIYEPENHFGFVHFVNENLPQELENQAARTLAYVRGNQLVLFTQREEIPLEVAVVDLETAQAHFKELSRIPEDTMRHHKYFTIASAVSDDKIFQVRAYRDSITLDVFHIPNLDLVHSFTWSAAQQPVFAVAPHTLNTGDPKPETNTFQDYLEALKDGPLALAVNQTESGGYLLTIGRYKDPKAPYNHFGYPIFDKGNGGASSAPGMNAPIPSGGPPMMPGTVVPSTPGSMGTGYSGGDLLGDLRPASLDPGRLEFKTTLAKIFLDGHSLDNVKGSNLPIGDADLSAVMEERKEKDAASSFYSDGKFFSGAYDKAAGAYIIREIPL